MNAIWVPGPHVLTVTGIAEQDARDLLSISAYIGGSPGGPRGAIDRLAAALMAVGGIARQSLESVPVHDSLHVERKGGN